MRNLLAFLRVRARELQSHSGDRRGGHFSRGASLRSHHRSRESARGLCVNVHVPRDVEAL